MFLVSKWHIIVDVMYLVYLFSRGVSNHKTEERPHVEWIRKSLFFITIDLNFQKGDWRRVQDSGQYADQHHGLWGRLYLWNTQHGKSTPVNVAKMSSDVTNSQHGKSTPINETKAANDVTNTHHLFFCHYHKTIKMLLLISLIDIYWQQKLKIFMKTWTKYFDLISLFIERSNL